MDKMLAQKELDTIRDMVKELEKIINEPEVSKEKEMSDFLFNSIDGCVRKMTKGEKEVTYYKDNEWVIKQDYENKVLWIRYSLIWFVFNTKFGLNYTQIRDFIAAWVEANTEWRGLTPNNRLCQAGLRM
jgi:hypothetical protein